MKKVIKWILVFILGIPVIILAFGKKYSCQILAEARCEKATLPTGNIQIPHERTIDWNSYSNFADSIFNFWADKPVPGLKKLESKGNGPRILLAKLLLRKDVDEVNKAIMQMTAWGTSGSSWALNKKGDYDFALSILTPVLWKFGNDSTILYPKTRDHLLNVLLTEDGDKFRYTAPRTFGLVAETENHILMTEGSRYLKNRWLAQHGNKNPHFDNISNGMENKIIDFLDDIEHEGLYEFNSNPYIGYTITTLLNLDAFASDAVKTKARDVLDYMNWCYALGSYQLKHYPPFRRRYDKVGFTSLTTDYQSIFMKAWLSYSPFQSFNRDIHKGEVHALMGACMPYRPPDKVVKVIFDKENGYFVKIGHGPESCPEIYSAGHHFLLSAGGANQGKRSLIVARPITLFLDDSAQDLSGTFHLAGPGKDFMKWNNTGVYKNFACAAGPVSVPANYKPEIKNNHWAFYSANNSICLAVYSTEHLGIITVFENLDPKVVAERILKANPDSEKLKHYFKFPGGSLIQYDVNAPKNNWVIISDNGKVLHRDFDKWPLLEGQFNQN